MDALNLPPYDIKVSEKDGKRLIFDELRRRYVALTPEEWVRQHFVHYLIGHLGYPAGLLANEVELKIGDKRLRCDSILFDKQAHPQMIIEYKAPNIQLTQRVFSQISAYNLLLHVDYLIVSNGMRHICCRMDYTNNTYHFLQEIPTYEEVMSDK
jgi:hypothetical protein